MYVYVVKSVAQARHVRCCLQVKTLLTHTLTHLLTHLLLHLKQ